MRSQSVSRFPQTALLGLAIGVAAGLAAGLLVAPLRGSDMRASLRSRAADGGARLQSLASSGGRWAQHALDRALMLVEEGRRAFSRGGRRPAESLSAPLGEIASIHSGTRAGNWEATS